MNTPKPPGSPPPPLLPEDTLGAEERSCLLRAARRRLLELTDELRRLEALPIHYAVAPIEATQAEMACLSKGVSWLWKHAVGP